MLDAAARAAEGDFNPLPSCEGRREKIQGRHVVQAHFNPLPSREGRPPLPERRKKMSEFQSTPLMRGETFTVENSYLGLSISIHSPHARGDRRAGEACRMRTSFQSTPLTRGETKSQSFTIRAPRFQSTPLTRGETRHAPRIAHCSTHFNPLPSREGRRKVNVS